MKNAEGIFERPYPLYQASRVIRICGGGTGPLHAVMPIAMSPLRVLSGNLTARCVEIRQKQKNAARLRPKATYAALVAAFTTRGNEGDAVETHKYSQSLRFNACWSCYSDKLECAASETGLQHFDPLL